MDAIQFGRWISTRRRMNGWSSQRALVESARQHPLLRGLGISEDFLARLEAGQLAHPFRGKVRQRVLMLAWVLCKTPRDVQIYLRAAELSGLSADEATQLNGLQGLLEKRKTLAVFPLPPRPTRLFGREHLLQELVSKLSALDTGLCAITGMPGVGKSALAYEAIHRLAFNQHEQLNAFPDGIATFSATGRRGLNGLIALLNEIAAVFSASTASISQARHSRASSATSAHSPALPGNAGDDLAGAVDRVRMVLADKRVLLFLDDVDAGFPLRPALQALLAQNQQSLGVNGVSETGHLHRVVLITSRYIPAPAFLTSHFHLGPLERDAALELFTALLGHSLDAEELADAERLCAAVGHLPLAIEVAVTATNTKGIPLSLLAARAVDHPLDSVLDGEHELRSTLSQALDAVDAEARERFVLLSTLGVRSFGLESAAAVHTKSSHALLPPQQAVIEPGKVTFSDSAGDGSSASLAQLANTAADLGQFVRHSLVELVSNQEPVPLLISNGHSRSTATRYHVHPLIHAHAFDRLQTFDPEVVKTAESNIQSFALAYVERYQKDTVRLERERELLLATMAQARHNEQYPEVVQFMSLLLYFFGWNGRFDEAEQVLGWGIHASQHLKDRYNQSRFMSRLGGLICYRGKLDQARSIWDECLEIAKSLGQPIYLWYPLANQAFIADTLGDYDSARCLTTTFLQRAEEAGEPGVIPYALCRRATYARLQGDRDSAFDDISASLRILTEDDPKTCDDYYNISMTQAELARVQGDYLRSQQYTEAAISYVQNTTDRINVPALLFEQARFAQQLGMWDNARMLALRTIPSAEQLSAHLFTKRAKALLQQVPDYTH